MPVAEKNGMELLSALMGEQGQETMKMMQRMERLKRLMGTQQQEMPKIAAERPGEPDVFCRNRNENMISAAIPFLNREYQRNLYVVVRLMEMRRVLSGGLLEVRERQEEPAKFRQRKMLQAVQGYLSQEEQNRLQTLLRMMDMKEIMEREGLK